MSSSHTARIANASGIRESGLKNSRVLPRPAYCLKKNGILFRVISGFLCGFFIRHSAPDKVGKGPSPQLLFLPGIINESLGKTAHFPHLLYKLRGHLDVVIVFENRDTLFRGFRIEGQDMRARK